MMTSRNDDRIVSEMKQSDSERAVERRKKTTKKTKKKEAKLNVAGEPSASHKPSWTDTHGLGWTKMRFMSVIISERLQIQDRNDTTLRHDLH
jgi:hypothetical protein